MASTRTPATPPVATPALGVEQAAVTAAAPGDGRGSVEAMAGLPTDTTAMAEVLDRAIGRSLEAYGRAPGADPATQLAPRIAQAMFARHQMVSVQLHPLELGSVQIRIVVDPNRKVRAVLRAEHPETLDLLQRHAVGLERALTTTGLGLAESDALTFDLGTSQDGQPGQNGDGRSDRDQRGAFAGTELLPSALSAPLRSVPTGLLDLVL
jgi:flagellar hook-length control protein FliK